MNLSVHNGEVLTLKTRNATMRRVEGQRRMCRSPDALVFTSSATASESR
jgi:hypothetical protein